MQIYLDNSATTYPKPENVRKAVSNAMVMYGANPGRSAYKMARATSQAVYNVRKKVSDFFGANGAEKVVFTKSCTESLNIVMFGSLKKGDHIVISDLEHNAVLRTVHALSKIGVEYTVFETFKDEEQTINSLRNALKANTKLMVCTVASNVFGIRLPVGRLCALCHMYDVNTCIDAAQGAGVVDIDMERDMIDFLCVPSHKGLFGIMGAGVLIAQKELNPLTFGGTGTNSFELDMPEDFPERLESGTINVPAIISIGSGIDFINSKGLAKIRQDEIKKINFIYRNLKANKNVILYTDEPNEKSFVPVLSFNVKDKNCEDVAQFLATKDIAVRAGLHCAPLAHKKMKTLQGTVRVSPSVFTTEAQIKEFVNTIKIIKN